jgi:hypothetical protein
MRTLHIREISFESFFSDGEKAVRASFLVSQRIAQNMKPYSDGELVKECLKDVAEKNVPQYGERIRENKSVAQDRHTAY